MSHRMRWLLVLVVLVLVGWGLRLYRLDAQSLWYDEAVTADVAQMGIDRLTRWTADDIQPPVYYYIVAGWVRLAGDGEWSLRFPSAFFGLLGIALAFALARRLFAKGGEWGHIAALLAALFMALSPLHLYYGQEARMYTVLTALGLAMAVFLTDWLHRPQTLVQRRDRWLGFIVTSIVALYTHYYAFFLLLAFTIYFLLIWIRRRPRVILVEGIVALGAIALIYFPWFPYLADRYKVDASYWQGMLKLDEALRHTFISFTAGETMLEAAATSLLPGFLVIVFISLFALTWQVAVVQPPTVNEAAAAAAASVPPGKGSRSQRRKVYRAMQLAQQGKGSRRGVALLTRGGRSGFRVPFNLLFLLCYLLVPVVGILLFSWRTPKFNPRYLMLASPAFLLLLAAGIARLGWGLLTERPRTRPFFLLPASAALLFVLGVFLTADTNLYGDPAFTKPDFRAAVNFVQAERAPDEAVVLVSGHMAPAWDYYAPGTERVRLPDIDVLDTQQVLNYDNTGALAAALAGKAGAWLVLWQDEVADPLGIADELLTRASGAPPEEHSFWHVRVRHYADLTPEQAAPPTVTVAANVNFGGAVELVGLSQDEATGAPILFWRAAYPLTADLKAAAVLVDGDGFVWGEAADQRLAVYDYPTFRWPAGATLPGRYDRLPAAPGTPAGTYFLRVAVYDADGGRALDVLDDRGAPRAAWADVGPLTLPASVPVTDVDAEAMAARSGAQLTDAVELVGFTVQPEAGLPGDPLRIELWLRAHTPPPPGAVLWLGGLGALSEVEVGPPLPPWTAQESLPADWTGGMVLRTQYAIPIWPDASEGTWRLQVAMSDSPETEPLNWVALAQVQVLSAERNYTVPVVQRHSGARFTGGPTLIGADLSTEQVRAGATLTVTAVWQAGDPMTVPYTAFVQLLDGAGRRLVGQDAPPGGDGRPTTGWLTGEVVTHDFALAIPADAPAGAYTLIVGLYDGNRAGLPRLEATAADGAALGDHAPLGTVEIGR